MKYFVLAWLVLFGIYSAQSQDWKELVVQSNEHNSNENYEQAIEKAISALSLYKETGEPENENFAAILHILVTAYFGVEDFEKVIEHGLLEKKVRENASSKRDKAYANTLFNLGNAYLMTSQFDKALPLFNTSLSLYEQLEKSGSPDAIVSEWKLATSYLYNGSTTKAKEHFKNAFSHFGDNKEIDVDFIQAAYDYASILVELGEYKIALTYLEDLQFIYEGNGLEGQEEYPMIMRMLANSHYGEGNDSEGKAYLLKALDSYHKIFEANDQVLVSDLNSWTVELQELGKVEEASILLSDERMDSRGNAYSLNNKAALAFKSHDYVKATEFYVEALSMLDKKEKGGQYAGISENLVVLLLAIGETQKALEYQEEALSLYISTGSSDRKVASAQVGLAEILMNSSELDRANDLFTKAIPIIEEDKNLLPRAVSGLAVLNHRNGSYSIADSLYLRAIDLSKEGNQRIYSDVLNNYGSFQEENRNFLLAQKYFEQALEVEQAYYGEQSIQYSNTCANLSTLFLELGNYSEAQTLAKKSMTISGQLLGKGSISYTSSLLTYGRILTAMGNYKEAEPALQEALKTRGNIVGKKDVRYAEALNITAYFYQTLGNFEEAAPLFEEAIEIYKNTVGAASIQYATAMENLATLYQLTNRPDKALPLLKEALEIDREVLGENHPLFSTTLHNLASLYKELDKKEESEKLFLQSLEIERNTYGENHPGYARTLYNLAALYQDMEQYKKAESLFKQVLEIRESVLGKNHPDYAQALYGMATISRVLNKPEALDYYFQTLEHYLFQIEEYFPALSEKEKSAFYEKIKPVFESFKDYAIEQAILGNNDVLIQLYNLQLSTKALLLNASSKVRERILSGNDQELITSFNEWLQLKEQIVKYFNYSLEELKQEDVNLDNLISEANSLEKKISSRSELFLNEIDKGIISWKEVKNNLPDNTAAIELFRIEKQFVEDSIFYAALIVQSGSQYPELVVFPNGVQLETRLFNYYRNAVKFTVGDVISYNNFWKPVSGHLEGVSTIYISADGIFNKLNINTLYDPQDKKYVIDEYNVRYLSNTRELAENKERTTELKEDYAFVLGDPHFGKTVQQNTSQTRASAYGFTTA
ncbi:MAG: tetratricopeptide repeat protein, partial [Cyclobacteriaceae bacterium]|nr:tetratricopeptide repeat protein [Cyclobacteriaceae bacterium]